MTLSTIMTLSFWTNRSGQTMQTQIRLLLEEHQGPHCLLFHLYLYNKIPSGFAAYMVKIQSKMKELECSQHYYYIHIHCFFQKPKGSLLRNMWWDLAEISFKLACMPSLPPRMKKILLKIKALECSQDFSHYKSMGIFPVAQGQLTPQSMVGSGRITNLT